MSKYLEYFDGAFDSTVADKRKLENKPYIAYSKTGGVVYTIIPKEEKDMWIISAIKLKDISNCTYNMVDLGLPSGLKWADRNVGATSPEDYGSYFQWGDINAYTYDGAGEITAAELAEMLNPLFSSALGMEITADNVGMILEEMGITGTDLTNTPDGALGFSLDKSFNWDSYFDTTSTIVDEDGDVLPTNFNKYKTPGGLTVLELEDDAAYVHMGSNYRIPTYDELEELMNNTTHTFIDINNVEYSQEQANNGAIEQGKLKGVKFTGSNGNSIFIPAAGYCYESLLGAIGAYGELWSSSLSGRYDGYARFLHFRYGGFVDDYGDIRCYGRSVRGVQAQS